MSEYSQPTSHSLSPQDQFIWIHLFLVVLVSTSLFFVVILHERDVARADIESYCELLSFLECD